MPDEGDRDDKPALIQAALGCAFGIVLLASASWGYRTWSLRSERERALRSNTESLIYDMGMNLNQHRSTHGEFPAPLAGGLDGRSGSPCEFHESFLDESGRLLDYWKRPIVYRVHPANLARPKPRFELYSLGPNGIDEGGAGDDIDP